MWGALSVGCFSRSVSLGIGRSNPVFRFTIADLRFAIAARGAPIVPQPRWAPGCGLAALRPRGATMGGRRPQGDLSLRLRGLCRGRCAVANQFARRGAFVLANVVVMVILHGNSRQ